MLDANAWQDALACHAAVPELFAQLSNLLNHELAPFGYRLENCGQAYSTVSTPGEDADVKVRYPIRGDEPEPVGQLLARLRVHCPAEHSYGTADVSLQLEAATGKRICSIAAVAAEAVLPGHADARQGVPWLLHQLSEQLARSTALPRHCAGLAERLNAELAP